MNKAKWVRSSLTGGLELIVEEGGQWKNYKQSVLFVPDDTTQGASRGFPTFQNCIKHGYLVEKTND